MHSVQRKVQEVRCAEHEASLARPDSPEKERYIDKHMTQHMVGGILTSYILN